MQIVRPRRRQSVFQALDRPLYNSLGCRNGVPLQVSPNNGNGIVMDGRRATLERCQEWRPNKHVHASILASFFAPKSKCIPVWQRQQSPLPPLSLPPSRCHLVAGPHSVLLSNPADNCQTILSPQQQQINATPAAHFSAPSTLYALLTNGCPTGWGMD